MTKAFIFLNGEFPKEKSFYDNLNIQSHSLFCADGGAKKAIELNIVPSEVWGDFDSLDNTYIEWLIDRSVKLKKFNKDKDFTDGELLIQYVSSLNFDDIYVVGGLGGRIDHALTNINLIFKYDNLTFINEFEKLFLVKNNQSFNFLKEKIVSFIPFSDEILDLTLDGFQYPLFKHTLKRGDSTCISNVITSEKATVKFSSGKLLGTLSLD
ncbi:thiamine diphosphokinase [Cetobacterium sp. 8H]|uniref:thiamine diphosphokinase n=1 Tax=Cetobacterium sp. 8H TaxID=2759681 RepID=UPI00163D2EAC|nr:thiamine diphosphokinase [Cetobacterium sp. 8H]MBC2851514.1 thiamine diphosphokinase [Cetobacterium sp. 8H]